MPIDNDTWHARIGIFCRLKPLLKTKLKNSEILSFLLHHATYLLLSILADFATTQPNHLPCVFNCITKIIPISQNIRLLKIANVLLFSVFFFFKIYCLNMTILRKTHGPKYSSPRFCHWDLNGLMAHDCIKITLI